LSKGNKDTPEWKKWDAVIAVIEMQSSAMQGHQETPQDPSTLELDKLLLL